MRYFDFQPGARSAFRPSATGSRPGATPRRTGLRRGDRRRRRPRAGDRLLSRQGARHHQRRRAGEGLDRRRQCRAQHHDHPLQLSAAGQHPVLRIVDEALGGAGAGPQLQRDGQPARRAEPLSFRRASATPTPGAATPCGCTASTPNCSIATACGRIAPFLEFRQCPLSDSGRAAAAARRHGAP